MNVQLPFGDVRDKDAVASPYRDARLRDFMSIGLECCMESLDNNINYIEIRRAIDAF